MAVSGRWRLHPLHLYLMRSYLGIEDLTLPLEGPSYGRTRHQLGEVTRREYSAMASLGLVVNDEVHPELARALRLLAKPYFWVDSLWFPRFGGEACWRALTVITEGSQVILGVQEPGESERFGGTLTVEVHENVRVHQVLLPTLPPAPPGNRKAVVLASSFRPTTIEDVEPDSFLQQPTPRGNSGDRQLAAYHTIGQAPHVRVGQIAANTRSRHGRVHRSAVLRWFDNAEPDGRYLDHSERGNTGETLYLLTPADAGLLGTRIDGLIASVR